MPDDPQVAPTVFERVATRLGYDRIRPSLPFSPHPLVLFAVVLVAIDFVVVQLLKEVQGYTATMFQNPAWLIQPAFAVVGALAVVYLRERYAQALTEIDYRNRTSAPGRFHSLAPTWLPVGLIAVATVHRVYSVTAVGVGEIVRFGGVPELVGATVITLGYAVVFAEFLAVYVGIMILVPRRVRQTDFKLDFLDPEGLGGLRPIGELAKTAYYFVVLGLVGYLVYVYGPFILGEFLETPYPEPGAVTNAMFTAAWLLTIATMAYGFAQLHWFMKRAKREELRDLNGQVHDVVDQRFDVDQFEITDRETFEDLRQRMDYVNATREYPTTFTMWSQILISLILPKAVQMLMQAT